MAVPPRAAAAMHKRGGKALAKYNRKKKRGKKKAAKKTGKKKAAKKTGKKRRGKKRAAKKATRRRRRGQKGPNVISHTDSTGLGKGRVKCPASKVAVATVAKHRRSGTYVFHGRCV